MQTSSTQLTNSSTFAQPLPRNWLKILFVRVNVFFFAFFVVCVKKICARPRRVVVSFGNPLEMEMHRFYLREEATGFPFLSKLKVFFSIFELSKMW